MNQYVHYDNYVVHDNEGNETYDDKISHSAVVGRAKAAARDATGWRHWEVYSVDYWADEFEDDDGVWRPIGKTVLVRTRNPVAG